MPRVSVIIPIGDPKYFGLCLQSVYAQTEQDMEIIHVNDHEMRGPSWARNQGLKEATGEWVMFLDADDKLRPHAIETLLSHTNDMVIGDYVKVRGCCVSPSENRAYFKGETVMFRSGILEYVEHFLLKQYKYTLFRHNWGRLYRRSIIEKHKIRFDEDLKVLEDIAFNFEYLKHCDAVTYLPEVIYDYRIHDKSQSTNVADMPVDKYFTAFIPVWEYLQNEGRFGLCHSLSHCIASNMVTILIRGWRKYKWWEFVKAWRFVWSIVSNQGVQHYLQYYKPEGEDYVIIPWLMRKVRR